MKEGYKQTKLGIIPDAWEIKKFIDFSDKSKKWSFTGGPFGSDLKSSDYTEDGIRIIQLQNIGDGRFIDNYKIYTSSTKADQLLSCNIYPGDIILSKMGDPVARACFIPSSEDRFVMSSDGIRLSVDENIFDKKFVHDYINSIYFRRRAIDVSTGSTRQRIGLPTLKNLDIIYPPLKEQKAIADCLSSWDKAIELQRELILSKEVRKKSLAQQLLTGKRRLPGFTNEWKEQTLGNLGEAYTGLSGKNKDHFGKGKPFITYMNVFSNSTINLSSFPLVEIESNENQNRVKYGDILFTVSSETPHEAGMAAVFLDDSIKELYLNSFCFGYRLHDFKILLPIFASFILRADVFRKEIYKLAQGSTRFNISKSGVLKINFRIPSIVEQDAIANVLETADKEIQLEKKKLADLQQQKKALMQQLLTGKVRLV
ncbi:MAG: restriction endonuclease subunit S [Flavobacteriia bacterium]|nr:restriction endonuclease subunit S [Flavobacteriia bacterium]MBH2023015.1 restriction endonuclease subunit S [Flavobacteriales bacterium]